MLRINCVVTKSPIILKACLIILRYAKESILTFADIKLLITYWHVIPWTYLTIIGPAVWPLYISQLGLKSALIAIICMAISFAYLKAFFSVDGKTIWNILYYFALGSIWWYSTSLTIVGKTILSIEWNTIVSLLKTYSIWLRALLLWSNITILAIITFEIDAIIRVYIITFFLE